MRHSRFRRLHAPTNDLAPAPPSRPPPPRRTRDPVDNAGFVSNKDGERVTPHPLRQVAAEQVGAVVARPVWEAISSYWRLF